MNLKLYKTFIYKNYHISITIFNSKKNKYVNILSHFYKTKAFSVVISFKIFRNLYKYIDM